jgi:hypothetical protein
MQSTKEFPMKTLLKTLRPFAQSSRLLARRLSPASSSTEQAKGSYAPPRRQPSASRKMFRYYLNEALSGGGYR